MQAFRGAPTSLISTPPTVAVLDVHTDERQHVRTVRVRCPHCGDIHTHGVGWDEPTYGHRRAHCTGWRRGRYVGIPATARVGYIITPPAVAA